MNLKKKKKNVSNKTYRNEYCQMQNLLWVICVNQFCGLKMCIKSSDKRLNLKIDIQYANTLLFKVI